MASGRVFRMGHGEFEWDIDNFISFADITSPIFYFKYIGLYLRICVDKPEDRIQVAIYSYNKTSDGLYVKFSLRTGHKGRLETREGIMDRSGNFCVSRWMTWREMLGRRCEILSDGRLTVTCKITELCNIHLMPRADLAPSEPESPEGDEVSTTNKEPNVIRIGEKNLAHEDNDSDRNSGDEDNDSDRNSGDEEPILLSKSFRQMQKALHSLFISGEDSDVTIKVQGKEFPAHRGILRVRSPVFESMFSYDMVEKLSGVVVIDDCDPDTFADFLNHVYTGSTKHISAANVFSLYSASDKYDLDTLKEECVEFMKANLTVDSFCNIIALAIQHSEKELIQLATEFFCVNSLDIIKTKKWQTFLGENSTVGNELFIKALSK